MKVSQISFKGYYIKDGYYFIDRENQKRQEGGVRPCDNLGEHPQIKTISEINPNYRASLMGDCTYINYKTYVADFDEKVDYKKLDNDTNFVVRYAKPKEPSYGRIRCYALAQELDDIDLSKNIEYEKAKCERYNLPTTDRLEAYKMIEYYIDRIKKIQEIKSKVQSYARSMDYLEDITKNKNNSQKERKTAENILNEFTKEYFYLITDSAYPDPNKAMLFCLDEIGRIYESLNTDKKQ